MRPGQPRDPPNPFPSEPRTGYSIVSMVSYSYMSAVETCWTFVTLQDRDIFHSVISTLWVLPIMNDE